MLCVRYFQWSQLAPYAVEVNVKVVKVVKLEKESGEKKVLQEAFCKYFRSLQRVRQTPILFTGLQIFQEYKIEQPFLAVSKDCFYFVLSFNP